MRAALFVAAVLAVWPLSTRSRVVSLDQCADQYVLALSPRAQIAALSNRAENSDSYMRKQASGLPRRRADAESVLAARPDVVVRWWGGEPRLLADLARRGVNVVRLEDADDFDGVRRNVRVVAKALRQEPAGERIVGDMDRRLAAVAGAWAGRSGFYLTSGGATTGPGTLVDAMMRAAGLANVESEAGFRAVSLERLVARPPRAVVRGFFETPDADRATWGIGRHRVLRQVLAGRTLVSLPSAILACPAWFAVDAVEMIAKAAPSRVGVTAVP